MTRLYLLALFLTAALPASAALLLQPAHIPRMTAPLSDVLPGVVFQLDATLPASYPGSGQTVSNLIASPADGAAQSAYDFDLGGSSASASDDPTFTGSANDPDAYFAADGNDFISISSGTNTTFLNALAKTTGGTDFTIIVALRASTTASARVIFSNNSNASADSRIGLIQNDNDTITLRQRGATGAPDATSSTALTAGLDYLIIASHSGSTTRLWISTLTKTTRTHNFNTGTGDGNDTSIFANPNNTNHIESGGRLYGFAMTNTFIDDPEAAVIADYYERLHGRNYIP